MKSRQISFDLVQELKLCPGKRVDLASVHIDHPTYFSTPKDGLEYEHTRIVVADVSQPGSAEDGRPERLNERVVIRGLIISMSLSASLSLENFSRRKTIPHRDFYACRESCPSLCRTYLWPKHQYWT